jgi:anti-sigma factor RsiW
VRTMKSTCDWEPLEALVLGELGPNEERAVRAHTRECESCARELRLMERDRRAIESLSRAERRVAPAAAPIERVVARVEQRRAARMRRATWVAAACAAALLLVRVHAVSASASPDDDGAPACVKTSDTTADDRSIVAADEAWNACLTMTPAASPPAPMSVSDDARVTGAAFSPLPREACE